MPILGTLIKNAVELGGSIKLSKVNGIKAQKRVLKKLLRKAKNTSFGEHFNFSKILSMKDFVSEYQKTVPTYDYDSINKEWWHQTQQGIPNVCWPGKIKHFALSSGTSGASSKYIPVSRQMLKQIRKTSVKELLSLVNYDISKDFFLKGSLMLGGCTQLKYNGIYYEGDLSGMTTGKIPIWFQRFYHPGKKISREYDWQKKINEIVNKAKEWDVSSIVGVPSWLQILMEKIIDHYGLNTIHDIWPNLQVFVHGGVSFQPYKIGFEKLLSHPLIYIETYLASEGFLALQVRPNSHSMQLVLDNGIFFEFVPYNEDNFDNSGNIKDKPHVITLQDVESNVDYAILISTCTGAWRYMIGDTIKFTDVDNYEIQITGRTKHFLNICGEHLSQANMNKAVELMGHELNITVKEFTVSAFKSSKMFEHEWFLGTDDEVDPQIAAQTIDKYLKELNDDYRTERILAISNVTAHVLPSRLFYSYLDLLGKSGGSFKFPRVLRGEQLENWENYIDSMSN